MKAKMQILILILLITSSLNAIIKINKVLNENKSRNKILRKLEETTPKGQSLQQHQKDNLLHLLQQHQKDNLLHLLQQHQKDNL